VIDYIKRHGVKQLINTFQRMKERTRDSLKWGDEVEYVVVDFDDANRRVRLCLRGVEILQVLQGPENDAIHAGGV
jgi:glutamate--cysteine ligase catalytic subunit